MAEESARAPSGVPLGDSRDETHPYRSLALHMQTMADKARTDEARAEFARLALLYKNLAARADIGAYAQPDRPPLTSYSGVVRIPLQETYFHYNREGVLSHAPRSPGVYALWNKEFWIYIGECSNIQDRLLHHLDGDGVCVRQERPTTFGFELIEQTEKRLARQAALIRDLMPIC